MSRREEVEMAVTAPQHTPEAPRPAPREPEVELVLLCARTARGPAATARLNQLLACELDWRWVVQLAAEHRVRPLLYQSLRGLAPGAVPADVLAGLRAYAQSLAVRNLVLTREMLRIAADLQAAGIPAVPYKGAVLAAQCYGDIALRQFGDLDILIDRRHFAAAKARMLAAGYRPHETQIDEPDERYIRHHHDYPLVRTDGLMVELQWGVIQMPLRFPRNLEAWRRSLRPIPLGGTTALAPQPADLLGLLCVHGAKHLWQQLAWIADIAELVRSHPDLDWEETVATAVAGGYRRMLWLGLLLAVNLLEAPVPDGIVAQARADATAVELAAEVGSWLFGPVPPLNEASDATPFFYLRMLDRLDDKLRLCAHCYPSLLRPASLLQRYGLGPFKYLMRLKHGA